MAKRLELNPSLTMVGRRALGMLEQGNLNLARRPRVLTPDGIATVYSMSFNDGENEVLIPRVVGDRVLDQDQAIEHYYATGEHLGKFRTPRAATRYARRLHRQQEQAL